MDYNIDIIQILIIIDPPLFVDQISVTNNYRTIIVNDRKHPFYSDTDLLSYTSA